MFLTRAAQIIGKEGFKTFGYALQQKMHQNMTDAKVYGIYQKKTTYIIVGGSMVLFDKFGFVVLDVKCQILANKAPLCKGSCRS